jgi:hypothetical protein
MQSLIKQQRYKKFLKRCTLQYIHMKLLVGFGRATRTSFRLIIHEAGRCAPPPPPVVASQLLIYHQQKN